MGVKMMTNEQAVKDLEDDELELLSSIEGKNRHISRAIAKKHGYTWKQVQALRKRYLNSIGKGD
jgi:hypothetical protein